MERANNSLQYLQNKPTNLSFAYRYNPVLRNRRRRYDVAMNMERYTTISQYSLKRGKTADFLRRYGMVLIFLGPFLVFFLLFCVYPLVYGIVMSLFKYDIANPDAIEWRGLQNYIKILFDSNSQYHNDFWFALRNTTVFAIVVVPLSIIVPLIMAILINAQPKGYKVFRALIYLPSVLPCSASGVIFIALFGYGFGYVNQWIGMDINWLNSDPLHAWFIILLLCMWGGWGGNFIILSAALKNVDKSLYEAASVDGCTGFRRTLAVTVPAIKNQLLLCIFNTIIGYFGLYGQIYVLTSGGPEIFDGTSAVKTTMSIMYYMQQLMNGSRYDVYGMTSAMGMVLGIIIGLITAVQFAVTRERTGGDKYGKMYREYIADKQASEVQA